MQELLHADVDSVRPPEADDVFLVAGGYVDVGGAVGYVVFFADGAVMSVVGGDGGGELAGDAKGVADVAVAEKTDGGEPVGGGPAVGLVPLLAGVEGAHGEAAGAAEERESGDYAGGFLRRGHAGPERIEGGEVVVGGALVGAEVEVEVLA